MLLAIDCGNTNVVFALFDGDERRGEWRRASDPQTTADEYAVWLLQLMALGGFDAKDVVGAVIANVVPSTDRALRHMCITYFGCTPIVIGDPGVDLGIAIRLDQPEEVGADRLVNALAAHETYRGPVIVIDFGTATTFDVVDEGGAYCGGAIAPGVNLALDTLHRAAAKLPLVSIERPGTAIGHTTMSAMQSGIYWGYVGLIEGLVRRISDEMNAKPTVVATGGLAPVFVGATDAIDHLDPDLTLRGLRLAYARNRPKGA